VRALPSAEFSCESTAEKIFSCESSAEIFLVRALPSAELPSRLPTLPRFTGHSQNSSLCPRMYKRAIVTYVYQSTVQNIVQSVCRDISESVCYIFHSLNADSEVNQHETV